MTADYSDSALLLGTTTKILKAAIRDIPPELSAFVIERRPSGIGRIKVNKENLLVHRNVLLDREIPLPYNKTIPAQYVLDYETLVELYRTLVPLSITSVITDEGIKIFVYLFDEEIFQKNLRNDTQMYLNWKIVALERGSFEKAALEMIKLQMKKMWIDKAPKDAISASRDFSSLVTSINQAIENKLPFLKTVREKKWRTLGTPKNLLEIGCLINMEIEDTSSSTTTQNFVSMTTSMAGGNYDYQNSQTRLGLPNSSIQTEQSRAVQSIH